MIYGVELFDSVSYAWLAEQQAISGLSADWFERSPEGFVHTSFLQRLHTAASQVAQLGLHPQWEAIVEGFHDVA